MKLLSANRFDASVCSNKQRWNEDKCRCECKELIDKVICDKKFISNPTICECECEKSYDVREYLVYKNCKCRKRLVDKLVEEMIMKKWSKWSWKNSCKRSSCAVYIVLFAIFFIISKSISSVVNITFLMIWSILKIFSQAF